MSKLEFYVDPQPKERPRFNGKFAYTPERTRAAETLLIIAAKRQNPPIIEKGAVFIDICFTIPVKDRKRWGKYSDKRPDLDNLEKLVLDSLNGIAYKDDGQIAKKGTSKIYGQTGRIVVLYGELTD